MEHQTPVCPACAGKEDRSACARCKHTPRSEQSLRQLHNRLNRIIGQLNGINNMLDENRYCGDILTQVAAAQSALQGFCYQILSEHLHSCVVEEIQNGNAEILDEAVELIRKMK